MLATIVFPIVYSYDDERHLVQGWCDAPQLSAVRGDGNYLMPSNSYRSDVAFLQKRDVSIAHSRYPANGLVCTSAHWSV
jgi:hypothetical protein